MNVTNRGIARRSQPIMHMDTRRRRRIDRLLNGAAPAPAQAAPLVGTRHQGVRGAATRREEVNSAELLRRITRPPPEATRNAQPVAARSLVASNFAELMLARRQPDGVGGLPKNAKHSEFVSRQQVDAGHNDGRRASADENRGRDDGQSSVGSIVSQSSRRDGVQQRAGAARCALRWSEQRTASPLGVNGGPLDVTNATVEMTRKLLAEMNPAMFGLAADSGEVCVAKRVDELVEKLLAAQPECQDQLERIINGLHTSHEGIAAADVPASTSANSATADVLGDVHADTLVDEHEEEEASNALATVPSQPVADGDWPTTPASADADEGFAFESTSFNPRRERNRGSSSIAHFGLWASPASNTSSSFSEHEADASDSDHGGEHPPELCASKYFGVQASALAFDPPMRRRSPVSTASSSSSVNDGVRAFSQQCAAVPPAIDRFFAGGGARQAGSHSGEGVTFMLPPQSAVANWNFVPYAAAPFGVGAWPSNAGSEQTRRSYDSAVRREEVQSRDLNMSVDGRMLGVKRRRYR